MNNPDIKSLFKYKPLTQFTLDIIANQRIYYPLPESFNDPFDTQCSFKKNSAVVPSTNQKKIAVAFPDEDPNELVAFTRKDLSTSINDFKSKLKNFGILSLSENARDILMWSHYADDHKGVCIELERNENNELGSAEATRKVAYTKNYPSLNSKTLLNEKSLEASLKRILYTKSVHWSYEKEWRTFKQKGDEVYPVPGKIRSITFGVRASEMNIDIVKKLINGSSLQLYQAQLKENEFGIKRKKIT